VISLRGVLEQGEGEINRTISDDAEEPESKDREPKPPKIRAEDNPWYLLATLYGAPEFDNYELQAKNTVAWNRYFAANFDVKKTNKAYRRKGVRCGGASVLLTSALQIC
jgi:hypothetical protein